MKNLIVLFFVLLTGYMAQAALALPYVVFNELKSFFGGDSCISSMKLHPPNPAQSNFRILIEVCSKEKAEAWQLIKKDYSEQRLDLQFNFAGKPAGKAVVAGSNKTEITDSIVKIFNSAFTGHRFYSRGINTDCSKDSCLYPYSVTIEMEPSVIQTFVDDSHEINGNRTLVAAEHLEKLVVENIGHDSITITTRQIK